MAQCYLTSQSQKSTYVIESSIFSGGSQGGDYLNTLNFIVSTGCIVILSTNDGQFYYSSHSADNSQGIQTWYFIGINNSYIGYIISFNEFAESWDLRSINIPDVSKYLPLTGGTLTGNLSCIKFGNWTPVIEGVSHHSNQTGWYLTIGGTCVIGWYVYGSFAGSTTSRFKITGCPFTPLQVSGGGGGCSGYTSANNIIFTGYELQKNANIYAVGQETSTSSPNRWQSNNIYQKASGDTSSYGTIAFKIAISTV